MRGFTFIETIVVITIFTLLIGAIFGFIIILYRTQSYAWEQSVAIDEARRGIEIMVKEIREARSGDDGSYPIEKAGDKEFIFYSDIDNDETTEKVRYFLGVVSSGNETKECQTLSKAGNCSVSFTNFLRGTLKSAQIRISVDGDFGQSREYVEIFAEGIKIGEICKTGCSDCPRIWEGTQTFDVTEQAKDNSISFLSDATFFVDNICPHSMKVKFEFSWTEELTGLAHEFRKGVTKPVVESGGKISYPPDQEKISILSSYVRNVPPIFEYYDQAGNKIRDYPARLKDTKLMKVYLVINVEPNRPPKDFELESFVQLRNLKEE